jgi:hypothetical protein
VRWAVWSLAVLAAAGGAVAGCHPTGTRVVDPVETALLATGFTLVVAQASRLCWLLVGVAVALLARDLLLVPAVATLVVALAGFAIRPRGRAGAISRSPVAGAMVGALGVQVILRWPNRYPFGPPAFHGFTAAVAAGLTLLVAASAWHRADRPWRRRAVTVVAALAGLAVLFTILLVVATLSVRGEALRGEAAARSVLADVGGSPTGAVVTQLGQAAADTGDAASAIGGWPAAGAKLVPIVAQQQRFAAGALRAASGAAAVGRREAAAIDLRLGSQPGQVDLARLSALSSPMAILDRQLHATESQLRAVASPWLAAPLRTRLAAYRRELARATRGVDIGTRATTVLPAMLGGSGTRHYLIAFVTPAESRGYDGLIGSYGLLTAANGHVTLSASGPISDVQDRLPAAGATLTGVPQYVERYGSFDPGLFPQDLAYSPDLPTDAKVFTEVYEQTIGGPIDGVLTLDPYGLAALLHFTGPVTVPGIPYPLTADNAARVLLTTQYDTFDTGAANGDLLRQDFLQAALHAAFDALQSRPLPTPKEVATVLGPPAAAGRISFWSFEGTEQAFLRQVGIDGAFPAAKDGDLLAVTTQNVGNNKIDAYLHTNIDDRVTIDPATGTEQSAVTVSLTNDSPSSGLPAYVIDSPGDPSVAPGANETWLTLYSPLRYQRVTVDGVAASMSATRELGVWAYSAYVTVGSGSTSTVKVTLSGQVSARGQLPVSVRLQPSANPVHASVTVSPAGAWSLIGNGDPATWHLGPTMRQRHVFRFAPS